MKLFVWTRDFLNMDSMLSETREIVPQVKALSMKAWPAELFLRLMYKPNAVVYIYNSNTSMGKKGVRAGGLNGNLKPDNQSYSV